MDVEATGGPDELHAHACDTLTSVRTTIELKDEHRARLLELAARRGEKGFSSVIADAIDAHLRRLDAQEAARARALRLRGSLSRKDADRLRRTAAELCESWR